MVIATALLKQTRLRLDGRVVPITVLFRQLVQRGVRVTVLFAGKPSRPFLDSLRADPALLHDVRWRLCPRVHLKAVLIDDQRLYLGSANLTGAGLGMKSGSKRNFEVGSFTTDPKAIQQIRSRLRDIIEGRYCEGCGTHRLCRQEHEAFALALEDAPREQPVRLP